MKPSRKNHLFSSYTRYNDHTTPQSQTIEIPIHSPETLTPITVHLQPPPSLAAVKIQSAYRSHLIRTLVAKISSVNTETNRVQILIQRQETVDAIRSDDRERIRINEALMALLLKLDSVPGVDTAVRELRRSVSRRIVGLQEVLDGITEARVEDWEEGLIRDWEEIEEKVCVERGGYEMERFCAENLGFRCLQRFLREP